MPDDLDHDEPVANVVRYLGAEIIEEGPGEEDWETPKIEFPPSCPECGGSCTVHFVFPHSDAAMQRAIDEGNEVRARQERQFKEAWREAWRNTPAEERETEDWLGPPVVERRHVLRFPRRDRRGRTVGDPRPHQARGELRKAKIALTSIPPDICIDCGEPYTVPSLLSNPGRCRDRHEICNECGVPFDQPSPKCRRRSGGRRMGGGLR
jgi:hypothetical protein